MNKVVNQGLINAKAKRDNAKSELDKLNKDNSDYWEVEAKDFNLYYSNHRKAMTCIVDRTLYNQIKYEFRKELLDDVLELLRLRTKCRVRGLQIDIHTQKQTQFFSGALQEQEMLLRHLEEISYIIADIECASKYLTKEDLALFERSKTLNSEQDSLSSDSTNSNGEKHVN